MTAAWGPTRTPEKNDNWKLVEKLRFWFHAVFRTESAENRHFVRNAYSLQSANSVKQDSMIQVGKQHFMTTVTSKKIAANQDICKRHYLWGCVHTHISSSKYLPSAVEWSHDESEGSIWPLPWLQVQAKGEQAQLEAWTLLELHFLEWSCCFVLKYDTTRFRSLALHFTAPTCECV